MENFVSGESRASEFARTVYFLIPNDLQEFKCLQEDFKKQAILELNPGTFQFLKIISDFEFILEDFVLVHRTNILTDEKLRQIVKKILSNVQQYFTDSDQSSVKVFVIFKTISVPI